MTQETRPLRQQDTTEIHVTLPGIIFKENPTVIQIPEHLSGEPFEDILEQQLVLNELAAYSSLNYEMIILRTLLFEFTNDNNELVSKRTTVSRRFSYVDGSIVLL